MRQVFGPIIIVAALWGAVVLHHSPPQREPAPALPRGCAWRQDPAVPGGAVCVDGALARLLPALDAGQRLALGLRIDVNRASAAELTKIPGVGMRTARAIVKYRELCGGYGALDELTGVRGLGPERIDKLRPYLRAGRREVR